ncbi:MAG TPA: signal peptidase I [Candidatus Binataceae bacterium]
MGNPARPLPKPSPNAGAAPPAGAPPRKSTTREYAEAMIVALVLAMFIRTFFIQAYKIPSGSMEPTLLVGDHILVNKIIYGLRMPDTILGLPISNPLFGSYLFHVEPVHRGDVVVFVFPPDRTKDFIKRVVGVAGDTIQVKDGQVILNGLKMPDPHAHFEMSANERSAVSPRDNFGPVTVPAGKLFMMGDNRDRSYDSRFWGFVDLNDVEGRAMMIYWSWDSDGLGFLPIRWGRFGEVVH